MLHCCAYTLLPFNWSFMNSAFTSGLRLPLGFCANSLECPPLHDQTCTEEDPPNLPSLLLSIPLPSLSPPSLSLQCQRYHMGTCTVEASTLPLSYIPQAPDQFLL